MLGILWPVSSNLSVDVFSVRPDEEVKYVSRQKRKRKKERNFRSQLDL